MSQKRNRSVNWDEEEKQLFRMVFKDYSHIIENKDLTTNSNKVKNKAWGEINEKFNRLNSRQRELNQLKVQWKVMKINARKTYRSHQKDILRTGGGPKPASPESSVIEIVDLLNPDELLRDINIYDSDGPMIGNEMALASTSGACSNTQQDSNEIENITKHPSLDEDTGDNFNKETEQYSNTSEKQENVLELTPLETCKDEMITCTPLKNMVTRTGRKAPKRKLNVQSIPENETKSRQEYVHNMIMHSKKLKEDEHRCHMDMAQEEHAIKMDIYKQELATKNEQLKCAILEREILELRKIREEQNNS